MIGLRSKVTRAALGFFFEHPAQEVHVNELARRLKLDSGNLTRKLIELEGEGLLQSRRVGNQRHFRLNPQFPLLKEYRAIFRKTVGLEAQLTRALRGVAGIREAWIFGSYARDRMDAASDIDLLAVGEHEELALQKAVAGLQRQIDRPLNVISFTEKEYKARLGRDPLLKRIAAGKKVRLI